MNPLVVERLSKNFGGLKVLEELCLEVGPGERRAIIGPNGAGKTTLFNLITGQLKPTSGRIYLFGRDVARLPSHKRAALGLARTFQITSLFPNLTVFENMVLAVQGLNSVKFVMHRPIFAYRQIRETALRLLRQWGLEDRREVLVRNLSWGDQRQMEILLALASEPKLLLLDEPTAGLSPAETALVTSLISKLDPDITLLFIEHDMDVAFQLAQRMTVLHQGRILAEGTPEETRNNSKVAEIYLGTEWGDGHGALRGP